MKTNREKDISAIRLVWYGGAGVSLCLQVPSP